MAFENFQSIILFTTLFLSALTAIFGFTLVHKLFKNREKMRLNNLTLISFSLIAFGYSCFAFAEMTYFVIYDIFNQTPSASMPDLYWFFGAISLFLGFTIFSIYLYNKHSQLKKGIVLLLSAGAIMGILLYYVLTTTIMAEGKSPEETFLGYFYPIASGLILISSASIFLFFERLDEIEITLLYLLFANIGIFLSDILYTYYTFQGVYGSIGALSDTLAAVAYGLCTYAFFSLVMKIKQTAEQ
ncbi:hypothetical protein HYX11_00530 [Candidatus Woesearchaeota archaeon]|nr:hypothetical protein [Candidatus Woesearchaeota archaeon]